MFAEQVPAARDGTSSRRTRVWAANCTLHPLAPGPCVRVSAADHSDGRGVHMNASLVDVLAVCQLRQGNTPARDGRVIWPPYVSDPAEPFQAADQSGARVELEAADSVAGR